MLTIHIKDPEIEKSIKQTCGDDPNIIARAFAQFARQQRINLDIGISIEEISEGECIPLATVISDIRAKYE